MVCRHSSKRRKERCRNVMEQALREDPVDLAMGEAKAKDGHPGRASVGRRAAAKVNANL